MTVASYDEAFEGVVALDLRRDVVSAEGPEAAAYLQGQLSQEIEALGVGESTWSFLLEPTGKVESHLRVTRLADDRFLLDTEAGFGEPTRASLDRFKLRTAIELTALDWTAVGLRGPGSSEVDVGGAVVDAAVAWPGGGRDLLGPGLSVDIARLPDDLAEAARIEAGGPRLGIDVEPGSIPQESGLVASSVSFTKGCYRGQELVERIASRGAERRVLRRFRIDGAASVGDELTDAAGSAVGGLTSVATSPRSGIVALGWVKGAVEEGSAVSAASGGRVFVSSRVDEE
ncbi:MAG: hypothetical protein AAGF02_07620 [Actinomycetota bacterium]